MPLAGDRRKRTRLSSALAGASYSATSCAAGSTTTENLSSERLYCVSREPFHPGERLHCGI